MKSESTISQFDGRNLLKWYDQHKRELPWRHSSDPYKVWLSEIILQQTRVDQGLPYYERFLNVFPDVRSLAQANEDEVLKLWEGLGYYSRARNLHKAAKQVLEVHSGKFPNSYKALLALSGVGPYTASAIGSIVFGLRKAAVDGNVMRVLARYFGVVTSIDESKTKKLLEHLANSVLNIKRPGDHNQAMMELGATICKPSSPSCERCPVQSGCCAYTENKQHEWPVRTKKTRSRERHFVYLVDITDGQTLIKKRGSGDVWQGLYEFPLKEYERRTDELTAIKDWNLNRNSCIVHYSSEFKHVLSHQVIFARFLVVSSGNVEIANFIKIKVDNLAKFAFPRLINRFLESKGKLIGLEHINNTKK